MIYVIGSFSGIASCLSGSFEPVKAEITNQLQRLGSAYIRANTYLIKPFQTYAFTSHAGAILMGVALVIGLVAYRTLQYTQELKGSNKKQSRTIEDQSRSIQELKTENTCKGRQIVILRGVLNFNNYIIKHLRQKDQEQVRTLEELRKQNAAQRGEIILLEDRIRTLSKPQIKPALKLQRVVSCVYFESKYERIKDGSAGIELKQLKEQLTLMTERCRELQIINSSLSSTRLRALDPQVGSVNLEQYWRAALQSAQAPRARL
jgi:hypothetical protein